MLTVSEYRKRNRKIVTLPSGGEVEIRKLSAADFLSVGEIPLAFQSAIRSGDKAALESALKSNSDLNRRFNNAVLVNGVLSMKIVDKPPRDCADDEVSVQEIDPADHMFLMNAISSFNNLKTEDGTSIRRFPDEPDASGDGGLDGETLRAASD